MNNFIKNLLLISLAIFSFSFNSCSDQVFNNLLLQTQESGISPKLDLSGTYEIQNFTRGDATGWTTRTKYRIEELLTEEINTNYLSKNKYKKGNLTAKINYEGGLTGGSFFQSFMTGFTLGILNVFGMPVGTYRLNLNATFEITANNGERIWKKNYSESKSYGFGLYKKNYGPNSVDNNSLNLFRKILSNFNNDLSKNISSISDQLSNVKGVIPESGTKPSLDGWQSNGSGIIISKDGYVVTNYHVIDDANDIEIEFIMDGEIQKFNAEIIQEDKTNDLAVIKIDDSNFNGVPNPPYNFKLRGSDVGTKVYAYGFPFIIAMGKEIKVTDGIISSKSGFDGDITTYQITAPIQPGNSGGPLFDDKGNFIGINSSGIRKDIADNVGYTIKSSYVANLLEVLPIKIELPSSTKLNSLPLTNQIKEITKYVVLIKVK